MSHKKLNSRIRVICLLTLIVLLLSTMVDVGVITAHAYTNLLTNPGFESGASQTPTGWSESGANVDASKSETGNPHSGTYKGTHWKSSAYSVYTYQTKTGLTNGMYTLSAWVMSGGGQTTAVMKAENCGGAAQTVKIPTSSTWTQITLSHIMVSNTQCTIGFSSVAAANQWLNFDDVAFYATSGLTMRGADVSTLKRAKDQGQVYYNAGGTAEDPLITLRNVGVNYIRLRIWNNPISGYNNKAKILQDALAIKAQGLQLMVDFHYSDTWADPGKQFKPASWVGHNMTQLQTDVYNYTYEVCNDLKNQGTVPDSVQIGNEITAGMLWDEGKIISNNFTNLSLLVKQGYNAIKACNPGTQVILHIDRGGDNAAARWWYDGMLAKGVSWDITGLSFYCYWHGTIATMQSNVADMKARYNKPVILAETAYLFTTANGDATTNSNPSTTCSGYAATAAGQASNFSAVQTGARNGGGIGVFYWEPTWVPTAGNGWDPANIATSGDGWDNQAVYNFAGQLNPSIVWTP